MKSSHADLITLQSILSSTATQDLLYLFGPQYEHFLTRASANGSPSTAVLWKKDKFRVCTSETA